MQLQRVVSSSSLGENKLPSRCSEAKDASLQFEFIQDFHQREPNMPSTSTLHVPASQSLMTKLKGELLKISSIFNRI